MSYQGSEHTSGGLVIYPGSNDPLFPARRTGAISFTGSDPRALVPALTSLSTSKTISDPAGSWTATVKASPHVPYDLLRTILDDDWVDVSFYKHGEQFHVMRGRLDSVRRSDRASTGVTVREYEIAGRDHGKVFAVTPVWFNRWTSEDIGGALTLAARLVGGNFAQPPPSDVMRFMLIGYLQQFGTLGRSAWALPSGLRAGADRFINAVQFFDQDYSNNPARAAILPNMMSLGDTTTWDLARSWSDPMFCELFCDLVVARGAGVDYQASGSALSPDASRMAVVFRDRPFPTHESTGGIKQGPWYKRVITHEIPAEHVVSTSLGRSGDERYNTFMLSPQVQALVGEASVDMTAPLMDRGDILQHGLRRMDVDTRYVSTAEATDLVLSAASRRRIRDWHALDAYLLNGSIVLGLGRPDIRVGSKVVLRARRSEDADVTCYVEGVHHSWELTRGMSTTLQVTRGWYGSDESHLSALQGLAARYEEPA